MSVIACPSCGSGTRAGADTCWLCGASLVGTAHRVPALPSPVTEFAPPPMAPTARSSSSGCFWIGGIVVSTIVLLFIAIEIALLAPGLMIPYAVLMVPIMIAFGRMVYIQAFRKEAPPAGPQAGAPAGPQLSARGDAVGGASQDTGSKVAAGVAMGLVGIMAVVGILVLLFIAAVVILFIVCIAMMGYQ